MFLALGKQHATHMRHISICGLSLSTVFFNIYLKKRQDFSVETLLNMKYMFWFSLQILSEIFQNLRRIQWDVIIQVYLVLM